MTKNLAWFYFSFIMLSYSKKIKVKYIYTYTHTHRYIDNVPNGCITQTILYNLLCTIIWPIVKYIFVENKKAGKNYEIVQTESLLQLFSNCQQYQAYQFKYEFLFNGQPKIEFYFAVYENIFQLFSLDNTKIFCMIIICKYINLFTCHT